MVIALAMQQNENESLEPKFEQAVRAGIDYVQIALWDMTQMSTENARSTKFLLERYQLKTRELWCGWHGPAEWDFVNGPSTLGIVPSQYRASRIQNLLQGVRYAQELGVDTLITHIGFLPSDPHCSDYVETVNALRKLLKTMESENMTFLMETGQETPLSVLRLMEDISMPNFGVNFDPANLMLYGNANALDAVRMLMPFIRCIHAKDGTYPTNGHSLGKETALGEGDVDFSDVAHHLCACGFNGTIAIENERDISPEARFDEIIKAKKRLLEFFPKSAWSER